MTRIKTCALLMLFLSGITLSCKKSTSDPDPIAISVTPDMVNILFRIGEEFDEMTLQFKYDGKKYTAWIRYEERAAQANAETSVTNTRLVPADAILSDYGGAVDRDGMPFTLKSDRINSGTTFKLVINTFYEHILIESVKLFNELSFNIGSQTKIAFQGYDGRFFTKYKDDPAAFSNLIERVLNSINDSDAVMAGNQPMKTKAWVVAD